MFALLLIEYIKKHRRVKWSKISQRSNKRLTSLSTYLFWVFFHLLHLLCFSFWYHNNVQTILTAICVVLYYAHKWWLPFNNRAYNLLFLLQSVGFCDNNGYGWIVNYSSLMFLYQIFHCHQFDLINLLVIIDYEETLLWMWFSTLTLFASNDWSLPNHLNTWRWWLIHAELAFTKNLVCVIKYCVYFC